MLRGLADDPGIIAHAEEKGMECRWIPVLLGFGALQNRCGGRKLKEHHLPDSAVALFVRPFYVSMGGTSNP
jgi:hypothetical protein